MNIPEWVKPGIYGAIIGAVVVSIAGFSWGGWVTGGGADKLASAQARSEVTAALLPVCLDTSRTDIARADKMETIKGAVSYKRRDAVMDTGWATMPGMDAPDRDLAEACLDALEIDA